MAASVWRRAAAASLSLLTASAVAAGEAYLVRDIAPGLAQRGSAPVLIQGEDGPAFLFAEDAEHGRELWLTDGTADGTRLLRDVCPGRCSSDPVFQGFLGGRLLFSARSRPFGPHGLWISDGTWEGSRALGGGRVTGSAAVGVLEDRGLFFFAAKRNGDRGLWATDGTPEGTRPFGLHGPAGWPRNPHGGASGTGRLIFAAGGPWVTDGTEEGTHPLAVSAGPRLRDSAEFFHRLGSRTTFFVRSSLGLGPCETELWSSDGTSQGTQRLAALEDPRCFGPVFTLDSVLRSGDAIWFSFPEGDRRQLWRSDGTRAGTRAVTSFTGGASGERLLAVGDGDALFSTDDGVHGLEPWLADAGGARLLADLCPGPCSSSPDGAWFPGAFYFAADDGSNGRELRRVEGDAVILVEDVCPGSCGSAPAPVAAAGGRAYFAAGELGGQPGRELWSTAVGGNGAVRLTDFSSADPFPSSPEHAPSAAAIGDRIVFTADDGEHGVEVWSSDGTPAGTVLAADVETRTDPGAGSEPALLIPWGDRLLFFAHDPDFGYQPWVSDGTEAGTRRLGTALDPATPTYPLPYGSPVILGGDALFLSQPGFDGAVELWRSSVDGPPIRLSELNVAGRVTASSARRIGERALFFFLGTERGPSGVWSSDGTAAGTERLAGLIASGSDGSSGELGGRLFFGATQDPGSEDWELWQTDGTSAGTQRTVEIEPGPGSSYPGEFARLGDRLLFAAGTSAQGRELWITDGTAEGTRPVADLVPGPGSSGPAYLTTVGERVFFLAVEGTDQPALWITDGTAAGTARLAAVPDYFFSTPFENPQYAVAAGRFFFIQRDGTLDLWVSDGTPAGTGRLRPLLPEGAEVAGVWNAGDRVRISVLVYGGLEDLFEERLELWESDGTFGGTRRLFDLPGTDTGVETISELAEVGSLLFFRGLHPEAGVELMALPVGPPAPCAAGVDTLCLRDGRFAVRAHWRDPRSGDTGTAGALPLPGSDRSGLFWFFSPDNVELVFKTLDGGGVNGFFWNFYGSLSDVEYEIEVTDTATGRRAQYFNPGGEICGRGDTTAFPARPPVPLPVPPAVAPVRSAAAGGAGGTACGGDPGDLCLFGDRFRVEVAWADQRSGDSGVGTAIPFADRSGFFWFFEPQNVELVVKILDATTVNGRFWVFYGGLSDVEYTITVTDTETQEQAVYHNPPGEICGRGDTTAF